MENGTKYKEIELRSEEAQEVMNQVPSAVLRYGITVLLCIVTVLLLGSAFFSYPDTVEADITLTSQKPLVYIAARSGGRIKHLYAGNKQAVRAGDSIGVIENIARTEDIFYLRERLKEWKQTGAQPELLHTLFFRNIPQLGSVQTAYSACLLTWKNYLQHRHENRIYETELVNTIALLNTAISEWEKNFLLTSPIDGTVAYMQLWEKNQNVENGETLFVIVPDGHFVPIGKALLPIQDAAKAKTGQRVLIRLAGFSEQEYGFLRGQVASISPVPDKDGKYILEIELPQGMHTNTGKELPVMKVMAGTASIVIKEQSLLKRLLKR